MIIHSLITYLQSLDVWAVGAIQFLICMWLIMLFARFFGKEGLYVYSVIAVVIANIQVLKAVHVAPFESPIPLGNVLFTSLFLVSDIITECYGTKEARTGIWLGFGSSLMFTLIMLVTIGMQPLAVTNPADALFLESHKAMTVLFTPSVSILAASLIAYLVSLLFDVGVFYAMKVASDGKWLWIRSFVSSTFGIIIDNIVFSMLAWVVFAVVPVPFSTVINSYVFGALSVRLFLTVVSIPVFYAVRKTVNNFEKIA